MTTLAPCVPSSSAGRKVRPSAGTAPSMGNRFAETNRHSRFSAPDLSARTKFHTGVIPASVENALVLLRRSKKSGAELKTAISGCFCRWAPIVIRRSEIGVGQTAQRNGVDDGKHCRASANAARQRASRHQREYRFPERIGWRNAGHAGFPPAGPFVGGLSRPVKGDSRRR